MKKNTTIEPLEARIAPAVLFAVEAGTNQLVSFDSAAPGTLLTDTTITGIAAGDIVAGIDFDPKTGVLAALVITDNGATRTANIYSIDPLTAAAVPLFSGGLAGVKDTSLFGFEMNPITSEAHFTDSLDGNYTMTAGADSIDTDLSDPTQNETITSIAFDRPFGGTKTTLYGYNFFTDELVTIGDKDGAPDAPDGGIVKPIAKAKLGGVNFSSSNSEAMGFDIGGDYGGPDLGWIALNRTSTGMHLYNIDLATAALTDLGTIGTGTRLFSSLTVQTDAAAPAISGDGKTATWRDLDGDAVTLKITNGALTPANFRMLAGADGSSALGKLTLTDAQYTGTNIILTAKPGANGGDGRVNVGTIDANGVDLGSVTVPGDLVTIDAGTDTAPAPSIKSLTVGSMAAFGRTPIFGQANTLSYLADGAGSITVKGDFSGYIYLGSGKTGSITIGGDVVGTAKSNSGSLFGDANTSLGKLTIKGSILGSATNQTGEISLRGVGSAFIGGDIIGDGSISGVVSISGTGKTVVKVGGNIVGGDLAEFSGALGVTNAAQVTVGGSVIGGDALNTGLISVENVGSLKIGGSVVGGSAENSGRVSLNGGTTSIAIKGSIVGGKAVDSGSIFDSNIGVMLKSLTVGGSIVSNGGLLRIDAGQIGAMKVGGDIAGYDGGKVVIIAKGKGMPATLAESIAIGSLTVGGDVFNTTIAAGIFADLTPFTPDAAIGAVKIKGDMVASSISAGINPVNGKFGDGDDTFVGGNTGNAGIIAKIASITIGGQLLGTVGGAPDSFAIQAEEIGALTVGKIKAPLTAAKDDLTLGFTSDIRVREL